MAHREVVYGKMYGTDWPNMGFLIVTHILGISGLLYAATGHSNWKTLVVAAVWYFLCFLAVAAGYHRYFAHRTHRASNLLELFYVTFGAGAFQARAIDWTSLHLDHHAYTDTVGDPHNIKSGFLWAHFGWLINRRPPADHRNVAYLETNPRVRWQAKYYMPTAAGVGLVLPAAICALWGDAMGGILIAGFLRLLLQYHLTFCVNSVAHTFGSTVHEGDTARNGHGIASWLLSVVTFGEVGKHGDHHTDSSKFMLARRWWEPDLAGRCIWLFLRLGLASPR